MLIRLHAFLCRLMISALAAGSAWADDTTGHAPDFQRDVLPIFEAKCIRCHGGKRRGGKLDMRSLESLLSGGESGPAIKRGNARKSLLIELIHYKEMPPKKETPVVTKTELDLLRKWIDAMPATSAAAPSTTR